MNDTPTPAAAPSPAAAKKTCRWLNCTRKADRQKCWCSTHWARVSALLTDPEADVHVGDEPEVLEAEWNKRMERNARSARNAATEAAKAVKRADAKASAIVEEPQAAVQRTPEPKQSSAVDEATAKVSEANHLAADPLPAPTEAEAAEIEHGADLDAIRAIVRLGHTDHCAKRLAWGDGECECGSSGRPFHPTTSALLTALADADEADVLYEVYNLERGCDSDLDVAVFAWRDAGCPDAGNDVLLEPDDHPIRPEPASFVAPEGSVPERLVEEFADVAEVLEETGFTGTTVAAGVRSLAEAYVNAELALSNAEARRQRAREADDVRWSVVQSVAESLSTYADQGDVNADLVWSLAKILGVVWPEVAPPAPAATGGGR